MSQKPLAFLSALFLMTACADGMDAPKGVPAKVEAVKQDKVILQTSGDFLFLDAPTPSWDWSKRLAKGDNVTLVPDKTGKSYSSIILKDGSSISFE